MRGRRARARAPIAFAPSPASDIRVIAPRRWRLGAAGFRLRRREPTFPFPSVGAALPTAASLGAFAMRGDQLLPLRGIYGNVRDVCFDFPPPTTDTQRRPGRRMVTHG